MSHRRKSARIFTALLLLPTLLAACGEQVEQESILDSLKISSWVLAEEYEDGGHWVVDESLKHLDRGYYLTDDGERLKGDDVFAFERLELNKPRVLAPMGYRYRAHVPIHVGHDGTVEIEITDEGNKYCSIAYSPDSREAYWDGQMIAGNPIETTAPLTFMFTPVGRSVSGGFTITDTLTDCEYYIRIRTFDNIGRMVVSAKLKLVSVFDPHYDYRSAYHPIWGPGEERTPFLSVELVEYTYSDIYAFDLAEE